MSSSLKFGFTSCLRNQRGDVALVKASESGLLTLSPKGAIMQLRGYEGSRMSLREIYSLPTVHLLPGLPSLNSVTSGNTPWEDPSPLICRRRLLEDDGGPYHP